MRVDDEAGQGLGVEIGRFLGHDVAVGGHGQDGGDRGRLEKEGRVGPVEAGLDRSMASPADFVYSTAPAATASPSIRRGARGRPRAASRRANGAASPPSGRNGSNASRRAVRNAPPSRVHSPNRPSPPRPVRRPRTAGAGPPRWHRARPRTALELGRADAAAPSSPRPRTIRWVGRTVSGSPAASRNSVRM